MAVLHVLLYTSAPDIAARAPEHFPAHRERLDEFHDRGALLLVGTFGDPQRQGSMAIFATREAAEEFVAGDPFVRHGVVSSWELREWNELYGALRSGRRGHPRPAGQNKDGCSTGGAAARAGGAGKSSAPRT